MSALVRRPVDVSKAAAGAAFVALAFAAWPKPATAADLMTSAAPAQAGSESIAASTATATSGAFVPPPGVRAMQPIPDGALAVSLAAADTDEIADTAKQSEKHCLATAIYFEARGESAKGQKAVAEVILARTRTPGRPKTVCGVVYEGSTRKTGCQFSFTCDRVADVVRMKKQWAQAQRIAAAVLRTRGKGKSVARGATFYHADYVKPRWASRMVKVAQIGSHIFYRPKRGRLS
jgi:spore germination cell wall hydrolase CwlJ-like protein